MTARLAFNVLIVAVGVVTRYDMADHAGNVTRCGNVYDANYRGIAVDVDRTTWRCGDVVLILSGGEIREFTVEDSGPLSLYCVRDGDVCRPIIADVAEAVWWAGEDISARAVVVNATSARERLEMER